MENRPTYSMQFSSHAIGLRVHLSGRTGTRESTERCWREVADELRKRGAHALLVIDALDGNPTPVLDLCAVLETMTESFRGVDIAYVEGHSDQAQVLELVNLHALEHGYRARIFEDEASAVRWLRHGESWDE